MQALAFFDGDLVHLVTLANGVDNILPFDHLAKDGVLAVEMGLGRVGDEELAAICARASICHRERASFVLVRIAAGFVLEGVAWAAATCASGVAPLNDEVADHTVEAHAVIVTLAGKKDEVVDCLGCSVSKELDNNITTGCRDGGLVLLGWINF